MKQCAICLEEFTEKFSFCPVDGTPLNGFAARRHHSRSIPCLSVLTSSRPSCAPTTARLRRRLSPDDHRGCRHSLRRLTTELREVAHESQLTWPEFKRDPLGFTRRSASAYGVMLWRFFSSPNVAIATMTAILVMLTAVVGFIALGPLTGSKSSSR